MNGYERRRKLREIREQTRKNNKLYARLLHVDKICRRFEDAYKESLGVDVVTEYKAGWYLYWQRGLGKAHAEKLREKEIIERTNKLEAYVHEREINV